MPGSFRMAARALRVGRIVQAAIVTFGVLAIGATVFFGSWLLSELPSFLEAPVDNTHWNATQIELDAMRLQSEADLLALFPDRPLEELRRRYDLFYSRADLLIQKSRLEGRDRDLAWVGMAADLAAYLRRTTPLIDGPDAPLRDRMAAIAGDTEALRLRLRQRVIDIVAASAARQDQQRHLITSLSLNALRAALFVAVALFLLLGLVYALDRIARRQASAIIRSSARWRATVAASPDAILIADAEWRIIDCNDAARSFLDPAGSGAAPADLTTMLPDLPSMVAPAVLGRPSLRRIPIHQETLARRCDGGVIPVEISLAELPNIDAGRFVVILRDISGRKAVERDIIQARDAALQADRAKSAFLAVISHEMRTPLNGLLAALDIVASAELPEEPHRFATLAQEAGEHLLRHVNDVLDVSAIDSGQLTLSPEPVDLARLLSDIVLIQQPAARRQGTALRLILPDPPLAAVQVDPRRMTQIVQNLLTNAIRATAAGTITVELAVSGVSAAQADVAISVTDTGIGIDAADQQRIFDDFVMVDASYRRHKDGTGLGLAIVQRLVRAMGGAITLDSAPGAGASFRVALPLPLAGQAAVAAPDAVPVRAPPQDILVIEDNAINRTVLEQMLRQLGHRVVLAGTGSDGVRMAARQGFDTILMDISMPEMDGIEATTLIRRGGASATSRILALTAHSTPAAVQSFLEAGMDGHLAKPVRRADLARALADEEFEPSGAAAAILDPEKWQDLAEALGLEGRRALLERFGAEFGNLAGRLRLAVAADDPDQAAQLAHDGAGMAGFLGAAQLAGFLATVENHCEAGDLPAAAAMTGDRLDQLCRETLAAFNAAVD